MICSSLILHLARRQQNEPEVNTKAGACRGGPDQGNQTPPNSPLSLMLCIGRTYPTLEYPPHCVLFIFVVVSTPVSISGRRKLDPDGRPRAGSARAAHRPDRPRGGCRASQCFDFLEITSLPLPVSPLSTPDHGRCVCTWVTQGQLVCLGLAFKLTVLLSFQVQQGSSRQWPCQWDRECAMAMAVLPGSGSRFVWARRTCANLRPQCHRNAHLLSVRPTDRHVLLELRTIS